MHETSIVNSIMRTLEMEFEQEKLWENDPMGALQNANVEKRKKMNWMAS